MYTYTYQKNITSYAFLLVFKIVESLQRILKNFRILKSKEDGNKICFYRQLLTKHLAKNKKSKTIFWIKSLKSYFKQEP